MINFTTHISENPKPLQSLSKRKIEMTQQYQKMIITAQKIYQAHINYNQKMNKAVSLKDLETCLRTMRLLKEYLSYGYWNINQALILKKLSLTSQQVIELWLWNQKVSGDSTIVTTPV